MIDSHGLNDEEVLESRKKNGSNALKEIKSNSLWHLFIESLGDPIIKILLIALAIKVIFLFKDFDWYETIGIVIAIFVASFISSISEYGSEKAFKRKKIFADYTAVCGKRVQISGLPDGKTLPTITGKFHHETDNES